MKRALLILSIGTLVLLTLSVVGQALEFAQGIVFTANGQPSDPTPQAYIAVYMTAIGGIPAFPASLATFVVGLVAMSMNKQYSWLVALCVAGALSFVGLIGMAWVLLSANSPVAFFTPLLLVPLVTLIFSLRAVETVPGVRSR